MWEASSQEQALTPPAPSLSAEPCSGGPQGFTGSMVNSLAFSLLQSCHLKGEENMAMWGEKIGSTPAGAHCPGLQLPSSCQADLIGLEVQIRPEPQPRWDSPQPSHPSCTTAAISRSVLCPPSHRPVSPQYPCSTVPAGVPREYPRLLNTELVLQALSALGYKVQKGSEHH
jgi:hypothetical protein